MNDAFRAVIFYIKISFKLDSDNIFLYKISDEKNQLILLILLQNNVCSVEKQGR